MQGRVITSARAATTKDLTLKDMTSIHDKDSGSPASGASRPESSARLNRDALARKVDELEAVLAVGNIGYCRLDNGTRTALANAQFKAEFGWAPDVKFDLNQLIARVHAEDRETLRSAIETAIDASAELDIAVRVERAGTSVGWIHLRGRVLCAEQGSVSQLVIVATDVTSQRAVAERANKAKDEFLSKLSHDLRSPLNAILGWNQILGVKRADDTEVRSISARIDRSARSQLKMVNDLLDLTRVTSGKFRVELRPMKLASVVLAAVEAARPAADARQIKLAVDVAATEGEMRGDADRLRQVVANLLSNAIKFSDAGGQVSVTLTPMGQSLEIQVSDSGQGIASDALLQVFNRFRQPQAAPQGHPTAQCKSAGLGIGLAVVREIVAQHGGTTFVASEGLGRGSTFTVHLPASAAAEPAARSTQRSLAGLSILMVDDDADARAVVAETLRLEGADVTVSDSVGSAVDQLRAAGAEFDVIVTDIGMPDEDGYSLVRKLRCMKLNKPIVAIALTGFASNADKVAAMEAGFDEHVAKPVDFNDFVPLIRRMTLDANV